MEAAAATEAGGWFKTVPETLTKNDSVIASKVSRIGCRKQTTRGLCDAFKIALLYPSVSLSDQATIKCPL